MGKHTFKVERFHLPVLVPSLRDSLDDFESITDAIGMMDLLELMEGDLKRTETLAKNFTEKAKKIADNVEKNADGVEVWTQKGQEYMTKEIQSLYEQQVEYTAETVDKDTWSKYPVKMIKAIYILRQKKLFV